MITTILATIVALGVLVTVHEFGHAGHSTHQA